MSRPPRRAGRRSKYGAVKATAEGITFHSTRERDRYQELRLLEQAGEIHGLARQQRFPLCVEAECMGSPRAHVGDYLADFTYCERGSAALVVEDVKGFKTPLYRWKKKHVEAQYGIVIRET